MADINKIDDNIYEVPIGYRPGMRVPGRIFVSEALRAMVEPGTIDQVANVATLPGIVKYSMAMPDAHLGYGFPIGGVAAFREDGGIISPGGVGFDINCGVRLLRTDLDSKLVQPLINTLIDALFEAIPSGLGATGRLAGDEHAPGSGKPGHGERGQRRRDSADHEEGRVGPKTDRLRPRVENEPGGQEQDRRESHRERSHPGSDQPALRIGQDDGGPQADVRA